MTSIDALSDEILGSLARADELLELGLGLDAICSQLGISRETYRIWRLAHSRTFAATARRVRALEQVQTELLDLIAEQRAALRQQAAR